MGSKSTFYHSFFFELFKESFSNMIQMHCKLNVWRELPHQEIKKYLVDQKGTDMLYRTR